MTGVVSFLREFNPPAEVNALDSPRSIDAAYRTGLLEGREQAKRDTQTETLDTINELKSVLTQLLSERQEMRLVAQADAAKAVATVIRCLCPRLAEIGLADAARDLMSGALKNTPRPLTINVATSVGASLKEALRTSADSDVEIREHDNFTSSRITVDWTDGSAKIDLDAITSRILELADDLTTNDASAKESTLS